MTSFMPFIHCYNYLLWLCLNTFWNICYGPVGFPVIVAVAVVVLIFYSLFVCVLCLRFFCVCVFSGGALFYLLSLEIPIKSFDFFVSVTVYILSKFEIISYREF